MTDIRNELDKYFTEEQLRQFTIGDSAATLGEATFAIGDAGLVVKHAPSDPWLVSRLAELPQAQAIWELAAYLKVRFFSNGEKVVNRARSGDLYDEEYYTKRGGGSPYVGYPCEDNGNNARVKFAQLADELLSRFSPCSVLDLGCATGVLVKALQDRGVSAEGVDFSEWAVAHAITTGVHRANATALPFPDQTFDLAISQDFMEHIHPDDLESVFKEQIRVLKPGGWLVHFVPFEPFETPVQIDAHLCNANRAWWTARFTSVLGAKMEQVPDVENQWDLSDLLARYFVLRKI